VTFLVVELSDAQNWSTLPWAPGAHVIPLGRRPTMLQPDQDTAMREARRLAGEHPGSRFVVFAPVLAAVTVQVPTHITLGGKVFNEAAVVRVLEVGPEPDDEGIPF
jgi:hypothetical protein